jgi:hypothetical protein
METMLRRSGWRSTLLAAAGAGMLVTSMAITPAMAEEVTLSGSNEVPPVNTPASGSGTVTIKDDHSVSAEIKVTGMTATAAHIHEAAAGANGPVIVPFVKTGDNAFAAPPGAKLTDSQYAAYKAGKLYVNVHSAAHPPGEVRAQLKGG